MRADCSAEELALLQGAAFTPYLRAFVSDADGTWRNLADLDGISHLHDLVVDLDIDNKVMAFEVLFKRDAGATRSLSPLRTDSVLNRNAAAEFAPLLAAGRDVYAQVGVGAPGSTEPLAWHTVAVGVLDRVSFAKSMGTLRCRDQMALLVDRHNRRQYTNGPYTTDVTLAQEIENALTAADLGDETPTLRVIGDPNYLINHFTGEVEPVSELIQRLAQLRGWDIRYLWNNDAGEFQLTLYDPLREKVIPDVVFDPDQYIDVDELDDDSTGVRNEILISYGPANHLSRSVPLAVQDTASITRYRRKTLHFIEASNSPIDLEPEAQAMIEYALADLKEPDVGMQVELFPFWPIELHDLVRFTANGVHFDTDTDLAVTKIRHRFGGDKPRTTLGLRGSPAAYFRGWIARARVPILPRSDEQADVDDFLADLRVERLDATTARITWTRASRVAYVFAYAETLAATAAFPAPTETPSILSAGTDELVVTLPQVGQRTFVQLEPRDDEEASFQVLGGVRRLAIDPFGEVVSWTYETSEPVAATGRVTIEFSDPAGFVDPAQKVRFRKTVAGVTTDHAATSGPSGDTTSGTYTFDLTLGAKHPTPVEAYWTDTDGEVHLIGSWTFDSDKQADVSATAAYEGSTATITARCDTDTAVGAGNLEYRVDGGAWTPLEVPVDRIVTFDLPMSSTAKQTVELRAKNSAGSYGPIFPLEVSQYVPASAPFAQCLAVLTSATDTQITVTVTGTADAGTPEVRLTAAPTGSATLASGAAVGDLVPSPGVWVFNRGAFDAGPGQAAFEAVLAGHVADPDTIEIPEQGRDTVALLTRARVTASDNDTVTVRVAVADPYPQGADSATVTYQDHGTGGVTPASGVTVTPAATLTEAAGTYADFVITRPEFGAGSARVTFTGSAANRIADADALDVPEKQRDTVVLTIEAQIIASTSTTIDVRVTATDPLGTASIDLSTDASPTIGGVAIIVGSSPVASGGSIDYRITRPSAGADPGRVQFIGTATDRVRDVDAVDVSAVVVTPAMLYGLSLVVYDEGTDTLRLNWVKQGTIDHCHVVWSKAWPDNDGEYTEAANYTEQQDWVPGPDIDSAGSEFMTIFAYVVAHDASHNVIAVSAQTQITFKLTP